jgi:integrase
MQNCCARAAHFLFVRPKRDHPVKLSQTAAAALVPRAQTFVAYDTLPGFGCRVTPAGARSWIFEYRAGGGRRSATRRMTLGRIEALPYNKARRTAEALYHRTRMGEDPAGARAEQRVSATVTHLMDRYLAEEVASALKPRTARLYQGYAENHIVPALGRKRARDVTFSDVAKLHRAIGAKGTQVAANRVVTFISAFYAWAAKAGEVPRGMNPAADISRFKEQARTRYLSSDEIARLGDTLTLAETDGLPFTVAAAAAATRIKKIQALIDDPRGDAAVRAVACETLAKLKTRSKQALDPYARQLISPHAIGAIRLLLLTGCRLSEILNLRWDSVDVARGLLMLRDSKTGARAVWLNAAAIAVLETLLTIRRGDYVIAGERPDRPRDDLHRPWQRIVKHAKLDGVNLHTLRHTHASIGVGAGLGLPIVGSLLGHTTARTTSRYAHIANDPARRASELIGSTITAALERRSPER